MMEKLKSKRFFFVASAFVVLGFMGVVSVLNGMEGIGSTVAISLAGIVSWYIQNETKRPSGQTPK